MNPDLLLHVVAALADYFVKTTLAFGLCFICSRLVHSPKGRLAVWLSFLFGAAGYWLWLAGDVFEASHPGAEGFLGASQSTTPAVGVWHLQSSWAFPLGMTMRVAGTIYLAVLAYLLFNHMRKWWRLRWVMKFTTSAPAVIDERFRALADGLGVGRSRLLILSGVSSPATFGWIRPTVLLPDVCLQQDSPDLDDIMLHELHHVRRGDFLWNRLATTCRAVVFFQPGCWYAWRRVNLERELACDLAVVTQTPERRATYAECLIRFARLHAAQEETVWGVDFAASQNLKARVHSILAGPKRLPVWSVCLRAACGLALLAGFVGVVPSLAVLLSYTQQAAQPLKSGTTDLFPVPKARGRTGKHHESRSLPALTAAGPLSAVPNELSRPAQAGMDGTDPRGVETAMTASGSGPQLLRRPLPGTPNATNTKQQTVTLLDPDATGQDSKAADRKQALEQSATTALGIYRRLGVVDRH
jgi:beta-lactamase regulating signal transducer with metallopeptidase domain